MGHRTPAMMPSKSARGFINGSAERTKYKPRLKWKKQLDNRRNQVSFCSSDAKFGSHALSSSARPKDSSNSIMRDKDHQFRSTGLRHFGRKVHYHTAPEAPRNTTSYIIRSKSMHGLAPVVTPSPFTPAALPTPGPSPLPRYKEEFAEEVSEWGVNGYGSMNGLIRVRSDMKSDYSETESEDAGNGRGETASSSHAQSVQQLEHRLDHDLSRFEMVYPSVCADKTGPNLEVRLVDQEYHIAVLEEENITLKERLSSVEQELDILRSRMHMLQGGNQLHDEAEVISEKSIGNQNFLSSAADQEMRSTTSSKRSKTTFTCRQLEGTQGIESQISMDLPKLCPVSKLLVSYNHSQKVKTKCVSLV